MSITRRALPLCLAAALTACTVNVSQPPAPAPGASPVTAAPAAKAPEEVAHDAADEATENTPLADPKGAETVEYDEYYDDEELGYDVEDYTSEGGFDEDKDGIAEIRAYAQVEIGETDTHVISFEEEDAPEMSEEEDVVTLYDEANDETLTIEADQDQTTFTVRNGEASLELGLNPDGTFMVDGQPAADADAAADLLLASEVLGDESIYMLSFLDARLARMPVEESRGAIADTAKAAAPKLGEAIGKVIDKATGGNPNQWASEQQKANEAANKGGTHPPAGGAPIGLDDAKKKAEELKKQLEEAKARLAAGR